MRAKSQELWDRVALVNLFDAVNKVGHIDGNLKVQKLTFLFEWRGQHEGLRAAHYRFFRHQYGPYSPELADDVSTLERLGFITKTSRQLTRRGRFLLEYVSDYIKASAEASRAITLLQETSNEYGRFSGPRLVNLVYAMRLPIFDLRGEVQRVRDVAAWLDILNPVHAQLADVQPFPEDVLRDLEEEFAIPPEDLEPSSPSFQEAVARGLANIG